MRTATLGEQLRKVKDDKSQSMLIYDYNGKEVGLYYGVKPYVVADPQARTIYPSTKVWNKSYILGTDNLGRDILTRLMYGTRVSLLVAFVAAAVNMVIGILFGGISGYAGGMVDTVMMRIVDIISTIPLTLYVILIMVVMGSGLKSIIGGAGHRVLGGYGPGGPRPGAELKRAGIRHGGQDHRVPPRKPFCWSI